MSELPRWFAGVRLNWAENFLWTTGPDGGRSTVLKEDHVVAATEIREGNTEVKHLTWGELRRTVHELATALQMRGVMAGDRVVMIGAHSIQTLVVFLATTWLGGVFSSSSTDMGIGGLLQRTTQIDPKVRRRTLMESMVQCRTGASLTDPFGSLSSSMMVHYTTARSWTSEIRSAASWTG